MKRRNAEIGKMRRPMKRTKITEGISMLYLKFAMLWTTVMMADYVLEFRFEFLWPFWVMLRSVYDSFKYQGFAFSIFFICIALTSDMICYFFIPLQYIFFAASTYVWVQYIWYTFADKGICLPTVVICFMLVYVEGALRGDRGGGIPGTGELEFYRPFAAHCVGYPVVSLGFGVKSYVGHQLRLRQQRRVREENEFYYQLLRDALPESVIEQNHTSEPQTESESTESRANGSLRRRKQEVSSPDNQKVRETNGSCGGNGVPCDRPSRTKSREGTEPSLLTKIERLERHLAGKAGEAAPGGDAHAQEDDRHDLAKGSAKSSKWEKREASTLKEEKKKLRKDKDKENSDSHNVKSTDTNKEQIVKESESTNENVKLSKENNSSKDREREKEREREAKEKEREAKEKEREAKEKEREKEREAKEKEREAKDKEREREQKWFAEELRRVRAELSASRAREQEARAQRRHHEHRVPSAACGATSLDRRRGVAAALTCSGTQTTHSGECESAKCKSRRNTAETEASSLRREVTRHRDRATHLQRDLQKALEQIRTLESQPAASEAAECRCGAATQLAAWRGASERAAHLQRALSAETRVKLELLSALGSAKRQLLLQQDVVSRQEKEIEELKAQMLAVMPPELIKRVGPSLDPNASVYTPKQLCSDA